MVGNRPQFIKSGPLSVALRERGIDEVIVHTGQHYDRELSQVFYDELDLPPPDHLLDLHTADVAILQPSIAAVIADERPRWVLVYGDTNSTLAGARAAGQTVVAHVEAGMRSGDLSMPEERNRVEVDRISALLFCPDERSADVAMASRLEPVVRMIQPLGYLDFAALASQARIILTDSGGLQKEAYWYGVPCVTMRPSTEWKDTVEVGANVLVDDDPDAIAGAAANAEMPTQRPQLYGDGHAAERIADLLISL